MDIGKLAYTKVKDLEAVKEQGGMGYTETKTIEVLPETTIECAFMEDAGVVVGLAAPFGMNDGDKYTVVWDDVKYCGVYAVIETEDGLIEAFGNLSIVGMGEDTGEPFCCIPSMGTPEEGEYTSAFFVAEVGTHTVSVSRTFEEVIPIAEKYIPALNGVIPVVEIPCAGFTTREWNQLESYIGSNLDALHDGVFIAYLRNVGNGVDAQVFMSVLYGGNTKRYYGILPYFTSTGDSYVNPVSIFKNDDGWSIRFAV